MWFKYRAAGEQILHWSLSVSVSHFGFMFSWLFPSLFISLSDYISYRHLLLCLWKVCISSQQRLASFKQVIKNSLVKSSVMFLLVPSKNL